MLPIYFFGGLGLVLLLTLVPLPKQKLKNTINKYVSERDTKGDLLKKIEKTFLIKIMTPKPGSLFREREQSKLKKSGCKLSLEQLSIVKVGIFIVSVVIIIGIYTNMNDMREQGVLQQVNNSNSATSLIFGEEATTQAVVSLEGVLLNKVIERTPNYKEYFKKNKIGDLASKIAIAREELEIIDTDDVMARKVLSILLQAYTISKLSLSNILFAILIAMAATGLVDVHLNFQRSIRGRKIEKEFEKIEAVIILLMNKDNVNVVTLLQQMKQQSKILKPYFQECLNQYTSSPEKALDDLIEEVNNNEFSKFITILKQCLYSDKDTNNQILKIQRTLRLSLQETLNKQRNKNKRLRLTLLQFPLILLLILLIMLPFLDIIKNTI